MESILRVIVWTAFTAGMVFVFWKAYLFVVWNIERAIFFGSVGQYLRAPSGSQSKIQAAGK